MVFLEEERLVLMDWEWRENAACKGKPTAWFFPESGHVTDVISRAVAVCQTCPVQTPCLEYAISAREPGIWGGMTETERRKARRFRMRPNEMWKHGWNYEDQRGWNKRYG